MKPHKHAELIKAWADGAEIQVSIDGNKPWHDFENNESPSWSTEYEYRIKPEPKHDVVTSVRVIGKGASIVWNSETHKVLNANLKLTFDGETGELKSAEVI